MSQKLLIIHITVMTLLAALLGAVLMVSSLPPPVTTIRNNNFTMWVHPEEVVAEREEQWL